MPVEQSDRDAADAFSPGLAYLSVLQREALLDVLAAHREAEHARLIASLREPDDAMVEAVKTALARSSAWDQPTAALAAAADSLETRDAIS